MLLSESLGLAQTYSSIHLSIVFCTHFYISLTGIPFGIFFVGSPSKVSWPKKLHKASTKKNDEKDLPWHGQNGVASPS